MLDQERATFDRNSVEWTRKYGGKFALVKDDSLVGVFDTMEEALAAGARSFGLEPFLVRQLGRPVEKVSIPALAMGLLNAHP